MPFDPVSYAMGAKSAGGGGGSSTLAGLTDVDISNPTDGQTLVYNATSRKWENGGSANGVLVVRMTNTGTALVLDKTWKEIYDSSFSILIDEYEEDGYISRGFGSIVLAEHENETYTIFAGLSNPYTSDIDIVLGKYVFTTDNENGYPARQNGN